MRQTVPDLLYPVSAFVSQRVTPLPAVAGFSWIRRDIYTQQWNVSVAREIAPMTALQVAYVGNRGINLRRGYNSNFFDPALGRRPIRSTRPFRLKGIRASQRITLCRSR